MDVSGSGSLGGVASAMYATSVQKLAQDQAKVQGEAAVKLIDSAQAAPPPGLDGQGSHVNRYA